MATVILAHTTMTYLEAAISVLSASDEPLTAAEIMNRIEDAELIQITGLTPGRTLAAALYRNIGRHPRLRKEANHGPGRAARGSVRWYVVD